MKSQSTTFSAAQPGQRVLASLNEDFAFELGLLVNGDMFPAENRHQSLSDRFFDASMVETLLRAGSLIQASAVTMLLDRVRCDCDHWAIRMQGEPEGFYALLLAVRAALK
ncbi:MAG: hypothetical protein ABI538_06805 [Pseudoxanthomonas sp.]